MPPARVVSRRVGDGMERDEAASPTVSGGASGIATDAGDERTPDYRAGERVVVMPGTG